VPNGEFNDFDRRLFGIGRLRVFADRQVIGVGVLIYEPNVAEAFPVNDDGIRMPVPPARVEVHAATCDSRGVFCEPSGFGLARWDTTPEDSGLFLYSSARLFRGVMAPAWVVVLGASVLPLNWLRIRFQHHRRRLRCLCIVCGYDLRASPDRCPECGTAAAK
jgi:hypothetical protein